jgi:uncharacterized protein YbcI
MCPEHERLAGGTLNAALANEIGRLAADAIGRGATRSRAFVSHDTVVCVLEDGATKSERTLIDAGNLELVRVQRDALQRAIEPRLVECVERLTGRTVTTFLSGTSTPADSSVEVFLLEPETAAGRHGSR